MVHPITNILSAPTLAFFLGVLAVSIHSDLEIPRSIGKFISLYLLFSIGFKGGIELAHSIWSAQAFITMSIGLFMAILTPIYVFFLVKRKFNLYDAGAIAASYGSISIVNFIAATSYLNDWHTAYGGYMIALTALMELPAIIIGLLLIRMYTKSSENHTYGDTFKEIFKNGSIIILLGSLVMGVLSSPTEIVSLQPFIVGIQKGMLVFFLLDMGLLVGKNVKSLKKVGHFMVILGILIPLLNAAIGLVLTHWFNINIGDSFLLIILLSSASYIAVPAAFKLAVPEADPAVYLTPALAITFPFNVIIGIPLYYYLLSYLASL